MNFICYHCNSSFNKKYNLQRHIITNHLANGANKENKKRRIRCCKCTCEFSYFSKYHDHLEIHHNVAVSATTLAFSSIPEFQKWKATIEKETSSTFSQTTSAKKLKNPGDVSYYFLCHRSFLGKKHKRKTKNKEKSAGSVKMEKSCPALIKAVVINGNVSVKFYSTHLGHECDIGRLRLSTEDRNFLAGKLSAGVPPGRILEDIKQNAPPTNKNRIQYTKMSDLYNIKKAYGIECPLQYDKDDRISVESWIKEKQQLPEHSAMIKQSHEKADEKSVIELSCNEWLVQSSTNPSQQYEVNFVKNQPCCVHICKKCNVCLHMLTCSCHDYSMKQNICKHIHSVMIMRLQQQQENYNITPQEFQDLVFHPPVEQNVSFTEQEIKQEPTEPPNIETSKILAKISAISGALETAQLNDDQRSKIWKYLDFITAEISISSSSSYHSYFPNTIR